MRGHLGFRLPRAEFLETRITQLALDELNYQDATQPIAAVTQFLLDNLQYFNSNIPANKITQFTLDALQFTAQQNEPRISRMTMDALTYIAP